jgi:DNA-binding CsgD family transcriptional regulator
MGLDSRNGYGWQGSAALTRAETRVLERVLKGRTNKEVALEFGCSVRTVEFHVSNILKKRRVSTRGLLLAQHLGVACGGELWDTS